MRLASCVLSLSLIALPAVASGAADPPPPRVSAPAAASQDEVAGARAEADWLIAQGEAGAYFDNITDGPAPTVRHRLSGLVCRFERGNGGSGIVIFPSPVTPGDDVGCNTPRGDLLITYYATRYPGGLSLDDAIGYAAAGIQQRYPGARPYPRPLLTMSAEGASETRIAAFVVSEPGGAFYTQALVTVVNDWVFKQRLTGPDADPPDEILSAAAWSMTIEEAVNHQAGQ